MKLVEVYTRSGCGYCDLSKALLDSKDIAFVEYNVYELPEKLKEMFYRTPQRTYPQIFIDNQHVGGFEDLLQLDL